ncbi:hypothetical protein WOLCODRAFT_71796 [Wolfiporia cocos MD-104 SS10]|uniref:Uncharacterized protein n=1 Tax=Wolfiporia cocos (strain MD-104) TaxID=742152 RepID=A0A2H3JIB4_WOLCO|nr:hypothetical protein WOLCODRAFT_71796 [Wolfiporia cocos MD-104 SS10]
MHPRSGDLLPSIESSAVVHAARAPHIAPTSGKDGKEPGIEPQLDPQDPNEISDQEWEIRTGRAIYILQQTLPEFFQRGLVSSLELPSLKTPEGQLRNGSGNGNGKSDVESIYSPTIRLAYEPPVELPPPFPRTLHVDGISLYMASSSFIRHTLNALYTDLHVELRRVRVHGSRPSSGMYEGAGPLQTQSARKQRSIREKSLFLGLAVSGVARVSGARGGWEVNSTYHFSPLTGLVQLHTVDSIEPAPHQAVFDALRAALEKLGLAGGPPRESPGAARTQERREGGASVS